MHINSPHPWNLTPKEAIALQQQLSSQIIRQDKLDPVNFIAGIDVGFEGPDTRAAIVILSFPELMLVDQALAWLPTTFPYIPGLLSFREIPAILEALKKLSKTPDLIMVDGQGIAHPRRLGIASHLGLLTDLPTIGVGKSLLIGRHAPVANEKGARELLIDREETIGAVLRSKVNVKPLYISIGHKISLETAIDYVMCCLTKYRLPETTRAAHCLASEKTKPIKLLTPEL